MQTYIVPLVIVLVLSFIFVISLKFGASKKDFIVPQQLPNKGFRIITKIIPEGWFYGNGEPIFSWLILFENKIKFRVDFNKFEYSFNELKEIDLLPDSRAFDSRALLIVLADRYKYKFLMSDKTKKELIRFFSSKNVLISQKAKDFLRN